MAEPQFPRQLAELQSTHRRTCALGIRDICSQVEAQTHQWLGGTTGGAAVYRCIACVCALWLAFSTGAIAQETTGSIIGVVTSQDGVPLPGVALVVNDPERGFERTAESSPSGSYKFVALAPGRYELQATLDGFQAYRREVDVALGRTVTSNFAMALGAVTDFIEVTSEAPQVDVTSTVSGLSVKPGQLHGSVPITRDVTQIAMLAPGSMGGDSAFNDASAGSTPGQQLVALGGASVAENSYQVNGLNITNFRTGLGSTYIPFDFVEEVQIKTGGYEAEYGRATGGVVNMVTKSGTNAFHGSLSAYLRPESLQEQEPNTYLRYNQDETTEEQEINASVGGPIVKDHLFFFAFLRYWQSDRLGLLTTTGTRFQIAQPYYGGKLDWNLTANHRLEATYISDDVNSDTQNYDYESDSGVLTPKLPGFEQRGGDSFIGKYTGILAENFLIAGQYGLNDFNRTNFSEGDSCPAGADRRGGGYVELGCWANWLTGPASDTRDAYRIDADWFLGDHSLRAGIDYERNQSNEFSLWSGGFGFIYWDSANPTVEHPFAAQLRHYENFGLFEAGTAAAYVQDSWAVSPNMTVNIGLRYEVFENKNGNGETFIRIDDQWAPRLGLVWDVSGQGRSKLYASFGLYYLAIPTNTNIRMAGNELFEDGLFQWDGTMDADGSPAGWTDCGYLNFPSCGNQGSIGDYVYGKVYVDGEIPDPIETLSTNIKPMSQWELLVGYEQMVGADWSLGIRGVARQFNEIIDDSTINRGLLNKYGYEVTHDEYRLMNPGSDFEGYADMGGGLVPVSFTTEELGYPEAERNYTALELTFKRRFAHNWMLEGSYTWSHLWGNYEGIILSDNGQDDACITILFDYPGLVENSSGRLQQHRRHNLKLFGAYTWDFGLQVGANAGWRTGRPINSFGVHPTDVDAAGYGADSFYTFGQPTPRGHYGTTDDVGWLDVMAKYAFRWGVDWFVRLDVFNIFNMQSVTEVTENAELDSGDPPNYVANPYYGHPTHYQSPRAVRLGVGLNF